MLRQRQLTERETATVGSVPASGVLQLRLKVGVSFLKLHTVLEIIFHLQLLENIGYIPCVVQHILEPI